ncbi:argininosuccinate lyase [Pseudothermotoga sp. U03pept]|uniref:argininosuccinate lyase n=1 Tax=Pseudothermotoga sp. U03pept TaxID=3447012 RepID=UPI003F06D3F5
MNFSHLYKQIVLDSSFKNWKRLAKYFTQINKAHLLMLTKRQILSKELSSQIARGLKQIENEKIQNKLPEQVEDLVMLIEKGLSEKIGIENAGFLHLARSRNDIDATVFRMCVRDELIDLSEHLIDLIDTVIEKAKTDLKTLVLLYTHGQPAQVSTLAHYLMAFVFDLLEDLNNLFASLQLVNICPMGAGAITTTGFSIDRNIVSEYLGFSKPVENSYRAIVTSHWIVHPSSSLKNLMNDLTRIVQDFIHKASCEVGIFQFPDDLVQISSIMPQKRNPVILEHLRIRANIAYGIFESIERVFVNTPYQDINENGDFVLFRFIEGVEIAEESLKLAKESISKVSVDQERVKELALKTGATTTELADELVRRFAVSFRQAHSVVSQYVRSNMNYEILCESFERLCGQRMTLTQEEVNKILSPENFVKVRKVSGGPDEKRVLEMIQTAEESKALLCEKIKQSEKQIAESFKALEDHFRRYFEL